MGTRRRVRKQFYSKPLHRLKNDLHIHVSKELRKEYNSRSVLVKKGQNVMVMRGKFKGTVGSVVDVDYKRRAVYVKGLSRVNSRGKDVFIPIHPSNLMLVKQKSVFKPEEEKQKQEVVVKKEDIEKEVKKEEQQKEKMKKEEKPKEIKKKSNKEKTTKKVNKDGKKRK